MSKPINNGPCSAMKNIDGKTGVNVRGEWNHQVKFKFNINEFSKNLIEFLYQNYRKLTTTNEKSFQIKLIRWRVVSMKTLSQKIDFMKNCLADSISYFCVIILNVILTLIIEIKILKRQFLALKTSEKDQDMAK